MDIGVLILRIVVGALMFGHGTQKLFGWFGGGGIGGTKGFLGSLGYPSPGALAVIGGAAEAGGGLLLATGFLSPLGAAAITGVLFNAIVVAHWPKVWNSEGGLEHPLAMATAAVTVAFTGPGRFSLDGMLNWSLQGTTWGVVAIGIGFTAGLVTLGLRSRTQRTDAGADATEERLAA
jgi:putative oxidoreductase